MSSIFLTFVSVIGISLISLIGLIFLSLKKSLLQSILTMLVSFAIGALFANVFLHLLPEIVEGSDDLRFSFGMILAGLIISLIIEKIIHWHHSHDLQCEHEHKPVGCLVMIGDGVHNITDGILIATSYLVSIEVGIATTIAVALHEIPQEIGDFAIMIHSGYSHMRALFLNFISALTAVLGAIIVLVLHEYIDGIESILVPIAAGNFLYIAGSDLVPELHHEKGFKKNAIQIMSIIAGVVLMILVLGEHNHAHGDEHAHEHEVGEHELHEHDDEHELHEDDEHDHLEEEGGSGAY